LFTEWRLLRQRHPLPGHGCGWRCGGQTPAPARGVSGVAAGALVQHAAARQHHHVVGLQRQRHLVQHADHRLARPPGRAPAAASRPGAAGRGWPGVRPSAAPAPARPGRGPAARAGARRPRAAQRALAPVPGLGGAQRLLHRGVVGRGRASQAWCGRRPSMATSYTVRSSPPSLRSAPARPAAGPCRAGASRPVGGPAGAPRARCAAAAPPAPQQGGFAGAVGADDAGPAPGGQGRSMPVQYRARFPLRAYLAR
jgi:hypothetical protein